MFTWILNWRWRRKIKKKNSGISIKNETDSLIASCIQEILGSTKGYLMKGEVFFDKITKRIKARDKHYITRDIMGNEVKLKHPIFSQAEISHISKTIHKYYFTIILFVIFETLLWLFAADAFFPELPNTAKYLISFLLGIGLMLLIEKGFGNLAEYKEALVFRENNKMDETNFLKYKSKKVIGYFLIALVIIVIIGLGIARVILLTPTESGLFTAEEFERLKLFNIIAPVALSVLSVGIAIYMGSAKLDQSAYKIKYDAYKKFRNHNKKTNNHVANLRIIVVKINNIIRENLIKYWQLVIDLKRILGKEYDERFETEYKEYISEKSKDNFYITEDLYRKFENVHSVDQVLFTFGVKSNDEIKKICEKVKQFDGIIRKVDTEYAIDSITNAEQEIIS